MKKVTVLPYLLLLVVAVFSLTTKSVLAEKVGLSPDPVPLPVYQLLIPRLSL